MTGVQTCALPIFTIKPILKRNSSLSSPTDIVLDPHPASSRKPDPRLVVSTLERVVLDPLKKPADILDVYDLLGMHQLDQLDFEEREIYRGNTAKPYPRGEMGKNYIFLFQSNLVTESYSSGSRRTFTKSFDLCINDYGFRGT